MINLKYSDENVGQLQKIFIIIDDGLYVANWKKEA